MTLLLATILVIANSMSAGLAQEPQSPGSGDSNVAGIHVTARTVDGSGRPILGAGVSYGPSNRVATSDALRAPVSVGDAQGRIDFVFPGLFNADAADRKQQVLISAEGFVSLLIDPETFATFGRLSTSAVNLGDIVLCEGATIRGRVGDASGRGLPSARVVATDTLEYVRSQVTGSAPAHVSFATTDHKGDFVLLGASKFGCAVQVACDGHYESLYLARPREDAITIRMRPGGIVRGQVCGVDGTGLQACLSMSYEFDVSDTLSVTDPDGSFRLNLAHPGRYRIGAWGYPNPLYFDMLRSEILSGDSEHIELRSMSTHSDRVLTVRVLDDLGRPAVHVRAAALWNLRRGASAAEVEMAFRNSLRYQARGGDLILPGPQESDDNNGILVVKARGCSPYRGDVRWKTGEAPLELRMMPQCEIVGRVIDEQGVGVPGVRVQAGEPLMGEFGPLMPDHGEDGYHISDDNGRFRLSGLSSGEYWVQARQDPRPCSARVPVQVTVERPRASVVLRIPRGHGLDVRVAGAVTLGNHIRVVSRKGQGADEAYPLGLRDGIVDRAVHEGKSSVEGLAPGLYEIVLRSPVANGCGFLERSLSKLELQEGRPRATLNAVVSEVGRIRGRVLVEENWFSKGRFVVRCDDGRGTDAYFRLNDNRSADMVLPTGRYEVTVIDAATLVRLGNARDVLVVGASTVTLDLCADLTCVEIQIGGTDGERASEVGSLDLIREDEGRTLVLSPHGIPTRGLASKMEVFLPTVPVRIQALSGRWHGGMSGARSLLGEAVVHGRKGERERVELVVRD